jgi:hypothetical protein
MSEQHRRREKFFDDGISLLLKVQRGERTRSYREMSGLSKKRFVAKALSKVRDGGAVAC